MSLKLYMIGVIVRDMPTAVQFYRRLGLEIPAGSENQPHVQVKMHDFTFFLDANPRRWDPNFAELPPEPSATTGSYPMLLEFYLPDLAALKAKYAELVQYGYQAVREPYRNAFGMYFAMIHDPDGNTILLSADAPSDVEE